MKIETPGTGTHRVIQRGVRTPDGQTTWGDPTNANAVIAYSARNSYNPHGRYHLEPRREAGAAHQKEALQPTYTNAAADMNIPPQSAELRFVEREVIIITGETVETKENES